ncbi:MAG: Gfo/Idh/MocA family oxidoreductase [Planctomycetes bacterium]|nr:Gfo/Idh/MocA family oxidoreductase [Planctomycetota bacterium]
MPDPIRIGLIGAGQKAAGHAKEIARMPQRARLTGVADIDRARAEALANPHEAQAHTDYTALFANADAVLVVSPNHLHYEQTLAAARARKHVFCEKPLSLDVAQAAEMVAVCRAEGVKLGTGFAGRFGWVGGELLRLAHSGELGTLLSVWDRRLDYIPPAAVAPWRLDPSQSGGVLFEYLTHELDWLREAGGPVKRVHGRKALRWSAPHPMANDHIWATLEFESGLTGTLEGSICAHQAEYTKGVQGTLGVAFSRAVPGQGHVLYLKREGDREAQVLAPQGTRPTPLQAFLDALAEGREPPADGEDGLAVTAIARGILDSAERGAAVAVRG